jgi:hypothetical protein
MKILIKVILVLAVFAVGYALGNLFPWSGFGRGGTAKDAGPGITGSAKLEVTILDENNKPVSNLEVDVAEKPGPPLPGGSSVTNENGVANFSIKAGSYYVYFNSGNFPQNLKEPAVRKIEVSEGSLNEITINLKSK